MNIDHRFPDYAIIAGLAIGLLCSCIPQYDFNQQGDTTKTVGEHLYGIWEKEGEVARKNPEQKVRLLKTNRRKIVHSIDTVFPHAELGEIDQFLQKSLRIVDSGLIPSLTRKVGISLRLAAEDTKLLEGLSSHLYPDLDTYVSAQFNGSTSAHVLDFDRLNTLNTTVVPVLLNSDGASTTPGDVENRSLESLMLILTDTLRDLEVESEDGSNAQPLSTFLFSPDPRLASESDKPMYVVDFDHRGYPEVTDSGFQIPAFVDRDGNGLADIDENGKFIAVDGTSTRVRAFESETEIAAAQRDVHGRLETAENTFAFDYVDITRTALHFAVRNLSGLFEKDILYHLVEAVDAIMGPKTVREDKFGDYTGYRDDNVLADLSYSLVHLVDIPELDQLLSNLSDLFIQKDSALAAGAFALEDAGDRLDQYPDAEMADNQTIAYDLIPVLHQISDDPALFSDVIEALKHPLTRHMGKPLNTLIKYRDWPVEPDDAGDYDQCFKQCRQEHQLGSIDRFTCIRDKCTSEIFSQKTRFDQAETDDNRSLMQRLLLLLWATNGKSIEIKTVKPDIGVPPIVELEDAAAAFLGAVGGTLDLKNHINQSISQIPYLDGDNIASVLSFLSEFFGTELDQKVKPYQLTRFLNQDSYEGFGGSVVLNTPKGKHGYEFPAKRGHADMLYASEASGLTDALHPLAEAFTKHDQGDLLVELFVVLHDHYSSFENKYKHADGSALPMKGSNLRSYEPALAELTQEGSLFEALYQIAHGLDTVDVQTQTNSVENLRRLLNHATEQSTDIRARDGRDFMNLPDNSQVQKLSWIHVFAMAYNRLSQKLNENPEADKHFDEVLEALTDQFLDTSWPDRKDQPPGNARFTKPETTIFGAKALRYLGDEASEAKGKEGISTWLTENVYEDLSDLWTGRGFSATVTLLMRIFKPETNRQVLAQFGKHLTGSTWGVNQLTIGAYRLFVLSLQREWWVPMARFSGSILDPTREWKVEPYARLPVVSHILKVLQEIAKVDDNKTGANLFQRGLATRQNASPFGTLASLMMDYHRPNPTATTPYSVQDFRTSVLNIQRWVTDDTYGLQQAFELIELRAKHQQSADR
jgi:hypothetical protein